MTLEQLNKKLLDDYGYFQASTESNWRLVWSENQLEKRIGTFEDRTPEGYLIRRVTECREVPKYRQWIHNKFVLERMFALNNNPELTEKMRYEPVYTFENPFNAPPSYDAVKFIVELVYQQAARSVGIKYIDPDFNEDPEVRNKRIAKIKEELYGDRTDVSDALAYKEGIVVPSNYGAIK